MWFMIKGRAPVAVGETAGIESAPSPEQDVSTANLCICSVIKQHGGKQAPQSGVRAGCL